MQPGLALFALASTIVIGILNILVLLWLQVRAYLRHRTNEFLLLALSSVAGIAYFIATVYLSVFAVAGAYAPGWAYLSVVGLLLTVAILGVVGTAKLFRSYRVLAEERATK